MNPRHSPALEQALAALNAPGLFLRLRDRGLPDDLLFLLRIAAGDVQARQAACAISGETEPVVVEAAVLFIQQVMFYPGSDSYRVLGGNELSAEAQLKEHYRWLVRWVHPDRNTDDWGSVYADRVNRAWQDLRTPERRIEYDARKVSESRLSEQRTEPARTRIAPRETVARRETGDEFVLSAKTARRLPALILVGLTSVALGALGLQYYLTRPEESTEGPPQAIVGQSVPALVPPEPAVVPARPLAAPMATEAPGPPTVAAATMQPPAVAAADSRAAVADLPILAPAPTRPQAPIRLPVQAATPRAVTAASVERSAAPRERGVAKVAVAPAIAVVTPAPPRTRKLAAMPSLPAPPSPVTAPDPGVAETSRPGSAPQPSVALQSPAPVPPARPATVRLIDEATANDVILKFRSAYASGNIKQVQSLLATKAPGWRNTHKAILKSYAQLFETSESRHIEIRNASWLTDGDTAILIASYEAWIVPRGESRGKRVTGDIRFDLQRENGELRIVRLRHDAGRERS